MIERLRLNARQLMSLMLIKVRKDKLGRIPVISLEETVRALVPGVNPANQLPYLTQKT